MSQSKEQVAVDGEEGKNPGIFCFFAALLSLSSAAASSSP